MAAAGIFGAALAGCAYEVEVGQDNPAFQKVASIPPTIRHELDLLFVVDNTEGMAAVHAGLGEMWGRMRRHLEYAEGGFPSVRVGVITSDVGVGAAQIPGCTAEGDGGALRAGADGTLWFDVDPAALEAGDEEIAARLAAIGEGSCAFEQPIAAMSRALEGPALEAGFVRDAAALGVVFIAGADDCSVADPAFFADGAAPLEKFRCFREGVQCGDDDVATGPQYGCVPKVSPLLANVASHGWFLRSMKDEPHAVAVGTVLGNPEDVTVLEAGADLALSPACADAPGEVGELYPGVRLGAFARDLFGSVADLCTSTLEEAGTPTALDLRRALGHRCLEGRIADLDPAPGMQIECTVTAIRDNELTELPPCRNPNRVWESPGPCYAIKSGPAECGDFPTQLSLQVNWGGSDPMTTPPDTFTEVGCLVEDGGGPLDEPTNGLPD